MVQVRRTPGPSRKCRIVLGEYGERDAPEVCAGPDRASGFRRIGMTGAAPRELTLSARVARNDACR
ncbi:MAG TPA: hypothetical protein PKD61_25025, partial [Polyangiaceae bacterium]|nr:hypothetical protein [Polyangiaceae bacterium]